jgi:hypothetical protein
MSNRKRDWDSEDELEYDFVASGSTNKRTKVDDADTSEPKHHRKNHLDILHDSLLLVWSQPMTERQKSFLTKQMEEMAILKSATDLFKPHTLKHIPFYAKKVKGPMNFSAMKSLLDTGGYSSVADLVTDFGIMMSIFTWINNRKKEDSAPARRLTKCFCRRMDYCPTGPDGEPSISYDTDALKLMATQMTNATIPFIGPSRDYSKDISIDDSDESGVDDVLNNSDILHDELRRSSSIQVSDPPSSVQNEPLPISVPINAKTPEPDDLDIEARQLQKEIEERQQKLAKMVEKKRLLAETRDVDTEKAAIAGQISETKQQAGQLEAKMQDCRQKITTLDQERGKCHKAVLWHGQEIVRLLQEIERLQREFETHLKEEERLGSIVDKYSQDMNALESERNQIQEQSRQVIETDAQLNDRWRRIEDRRAIATKRLDELNNTSI